MSVFRIEKTKNFTVMSNHHLRNRNLSYKAKGLLSFMLSLPEDWDYSLKGLCAISKESIDAIRTALKELQKYGYLEIEKVRNEKGIYKYNYLIYEIPKNNEMKNNPDGNNPHLDVLDLEKATQINTNKQNTKNKEDKKDKPKAPIKEEHNRLTLELIIRGYITENDSQILCYDELFEKLLKENCYQDLMAITHYIIFRVKRRNFTDEYENPIDNKFKYFNNAMLNNINRINIDIDDIW